MNDQLGLLLTLLAALVAGGVNAVAGGGSLIVYPVLLAAGVPPVSANVTTTVSLWPGYVTGAAGYRDELRAETRQAVVLSALAVVGAIGGSVLLLAAPPGVFGVVVPYLVLFAALLLAAQPFITRWLQSRGSSGGHARVLLPVGMTVAAAYGAYFGGGLGIILFATLALGTGRSLRELNGLKTLMALVANTVALVAFGVLGPVHWAFVPGMALASLVGGAVGARVARRIDPRVLRVVVVALGLGVGIRLLAVA